MSMQAINLAEARGLIADMLASGTAKDLKLGDGWESAAMRATVALRGQARSQPELISQHENHAPRAATASLANSRKAAMQHAPSGVNGPTGMNGPAGPRMN